MSREVKAKVSRVHRQFPQGLSSKVPFILKLPVAIIVFYDLGRVVLPRLPNCLRLSVRASRMKH